MHDTKAFQSSFEFKADGPEGQFSGYASVFGNVDIDGDVMAPGCFSESLKTRTPAMLLFHDTTKVVGAWQSIREDSRGLYVVGQLATKTTAGAEARELLRMNALSGLSVGFRTVDAEHVRGGGRVIKSVELWEISLVTFPANPQARVANVKNMKATDIRAFEHQLRGLGYSVREARALASKGWQGLSVREARSTELQEVAALLRDAANQLNRTR